MKEDLIACKNNLEKEEKYKLVMIKNGILTYDNDSPWITSSELYNKYKQDGEYKAVNRFEKDLTELMIKLNRFDIDYDELRINVNPFFWFNKKNLKPYNNDPLCDFQDIYKFLISIKFDYEVLKNNRNIDDGYFHLFNSSKILSIIDEMNSNNINFLVNYDLFVQHLYRNGYTIEIRTIEELIENQKESINPSIVISFKKELEDTKELKLK